MSGLLWQGRTSRQCSAPCQAAGPVMQKFMPALVSGLQRVRGKPSSVALSLSSGARAPLPPREAALHRWPRPWISSRSSLEIYCTPKLAFRSARPFGHRIASDQRGRLCIRLAGQSPSLQPVIACAFALTFRGPRRPNQRGKRSSTCPRLEG